MTQEYTNINAAVIDSWVANGWEWGKPIDHETYERALAGDWFVLLTPTKPVPKEWFGDLRGKRLLGLASGGGQQIPIFNACGARCTVLDYSNAQLESERQVALREGYLDRVEIIRADMTKPLPFDSESFDLIFHPISNCYVENVLSIWQECYRVLKHGGILLAGLDNGINFAFHDQTGALQHKLPFNPLKDPSLYEESMRQNDGVQFSHSIEEQIDGQLRAGLRLTHVYQDTNGYGKLHEYGVPTCFATRSLKD